MLRKYQRGTSAQSNGRRRWPGKTSVKYKRKLITYKGLSRNAREQVEEPYLTNNK